MDGTDRNNAKTHVDKLGSTRWSYKSSDGPIILDKISKQGRNCFNLDGDCNNMQTGAWKVAARNSVSIFQ